jgi:hypothetical protein
MKFHTVTPRIVVNDAQQLVDFDAWGKAWQIATGKSVPRL